MRLLPPRHWRLPIATGLVALLVTSAGLAFWLSRPGGTTIAAVATGDRTGSIPLAARAKPGGDNQPSGLTEIASVPAGGLAPAGPAPVVTDGDGVRLAAIPRGDLVEKGKYGPLPRIGDDGTRPLDAYARPAPSASGNVGRIAIVVGGLGVAESSTAETLDRLPGAVTLAFAPYGQNLKAALARAREDGHEILLQVPLEPYNFPAINPGPHTLSTRAGASQNLDDLRWLLSRITNYVGVVNYMGARFTSDTDAMGPVLAELGKRGLLYLDDGSSPQSKAPDAAADRIPFLQADVVLDADTAPEAIDQRLDDLVRIARQRGFAIGTGSAFPSTIERINAFAAASEKRGIILVPVTAVLSASRT
ncbi:MAG: divergent polysaccharide deacetylase family protein [Rhizobiales bacterium]|nr:divergent polysaccharide deacetylase family protein [Hyphomicrobiales bacterium]